MKTNIKNNINKLKYVILITFVLVLLSPAFVQADRLTEQQVRAAVTTWVRYVTADARPDAQIEYMQPYIVDDQTLAYIAHLAGGGFCLCGCDDWVLPVYLYSPEGRYNPDIPAYNYFLEEIVGKTILLSDSSMVSSIIQLGIAPDLA